jgi:hypothetical protein
LLIIASWISARSCAWTEADKLALAFDDTVAAVAARTSDCNPAEFVVANIEYHGWLTVALPLASTAAVVSIVIGMKPKSFAGSWYVRDTEVGESATLLTLTSAFMSEFA